MLPPHLEAELARRDNVLTEGPVEHIDCAVVGAGVIGLAVARALARAGREVVVLEAADAIGTGISSRNSEVVHAGIYYPKDSLKARLCVAGNRSLRAYAAAHGVALDMVGKLIVATDPEEERALDGILDHARANGVDDIRVLSAAEARAMEPALRCTKALLSPSTGIVDSHALMLSLQGEAEERGATVALKSPLLGGTVADDGVRLRVGGAEPMRLTARRVVVAAGLNAPAVGRSLGLPGVPRGWLCKGSYFSLTGRTPFTRLVYPVPVSAGLGVHFTLDLGGRGRFGPDVEWVDGEDYRVDPARGTVFHDAIRRYWPGLPDGALEPAYAGIRPKIQGPGEAARDFLVDRPVPGVVALYGIESPGLTSCLALADLVKEMVG
jgi:L-2-hydroxyglutarate oxidase LhgO